MFDKKYFSPIFFRVCPDDDGEVKLETKRSTTDQTVGSTLTVNLQQAFTTQYLTPLHLVLLSSTFP